MSAAELSEFRSAKMRGQNRGPDGRLQKGYRSLSPSPVVRSSSPAFRSPDHLGAEAATIERLQAELKRQSELLRSFEEDAVHDRVARQRSAEAESAFEVSAEAATARISAEASNIVQKRTYSNYFYESIYC